MNSRFVTGTAIPAAADADEYDRGSAFLPSVIQVTPPAVQLAAIAGEYAAASLPASADNTHVYFPDSVAAPFVEEARRAMPEVTAAGLPPARDPNAGPTFTAEQSRDIILSALYDFDHDLGDRARAVFDAGFDKAVAASVPGKFNADWNTVEKSEDPARWRLKTVEPGTAWMQRSLQADSPQSVRGDPANPNPYSVIDYDFDGKIGSLVYLAHELGHTLSDDNLQRGGAHKSGDLPAHMAETQAYYVQNILYGYIRDHADALEKTWPGIAKASAQHFSDAMAQNLLDIPVSLGAMDAQESLRRGDAEMNTARLQEWLGPDWKNNPGAKKVADAFDAIRAGGDEKAVEKAREFLDETAQKLHIRPLGILNGLGVYNIAAGQDEAGRKQTTAAIMTDGEPLAMNGVLAQAGVRTEKDMQGFVAATVRASLPVADETSSFAAPKTAATAASPAAGR